MAAGLREGWSQQRPDAWVLLRKREWPWQCKTIRRLPAEAAELFPRTGGGQGDPCLPGTASVGLQGASPPKEKWFSFYLLSVIAIDNLPSLGLLQSHVRCLSLVHPDSNLTGFTLTQFLITACIFKLNRVFY